MNSCCAMTNFVDWKTESQAWYTPLSPDLGAWGSKITTCLRLAELHNMILCRKKIKKKRKIDHQTYYITFCRGSWILQNSRIKHRFIYLFLIYYAMLSLKVGIMQIGGETAGNLKRWAWFLMEVKTKGTCRYWVEHFLLFVSSIR